MKNAWRIIGLILFLIGAVLAIVAGVAFPDNGFVVLVLALVGTLIGLIHIREHELIRPVVATLAVLLLPAALKSITMLNIGEMIGAILSYFAVLMSPAALIFSIKALVNIGIGNTVQK